MKEHDGKIVHAWYVSRSPLKTISSFRSQSFGSGGSEIKGRLYSMPCRDVWNRPHGGATEWLFGKHESYLGNLHAPPEKFNDTNYKEANPRCGLTIRRAVGHVTRWATGETTSTNSYNPCAEGNEKPADFIGNTESALFGSWGSFLLQNDRFLLDFSFILVTIVIYFHGNSNSSGQVLMNGMGES